MHEGSMTDAAPSTAAGRPTLLLLDGHSLAFRAFYALPAQNFSTTGGQHTNAVYGFLGMLLGLVENEHPTHIATAFDLSGPTFRSETFPEYKAQRPSTPPEFHGQVELIQETLQALGVTTLTKEAYEADDIIATLATRGAAAGTRVLICTGGDEIGDGDGAGTGAAMIRDANGPMLAALCTHHGMKVVGRVRTTDDPVAFGALLRSAIRQSNPTVVVTSGGISHGKFEVVRQLLSPLDGSWFGHVAQQPGGPQGTAVFEGTPVVCLPGNPVSTAVSFRLFVAPVLGVAEAESTAVLDAPVTGQEHKDCFHRAVRSVVDGRVLVRPVGGAGSHLLAQSVEADCLLRVPAGARPTPGDVVAVYPL